MKKVDFSYLLNHEFFISNVIAHYHYWNPSSTWITPATGRISNALMFFSNCRNEYYREDKLVAAAEKNTIAYLPKGVSYACYFPASDADANSKVVNKERLENYYVDGSFSQTSQNEKFFFNALYVGFDIFDCDFEEIVLSDEITIFDFSENESLIKQMHEIVSLSKYGYTSPMKSTIMLYELLLNISEILSDKTMFSQKYAVLQPAIRYLSNNSICNITVSTLAEICGISVSGFRNLFKDLFGVSPIDYILNLKAQKAKSMLQSGEMTVTEVANYMDFSNIGYFSRFYKKQFGHPPSNDLPT